jgi:hypothetical protein
MKSTGKTRLGLLAVGVLLVSVACLPSFGQGAALTATGLGPLVQLSWTEANDDGGGNGIEYYEVLVEGSVVATVTAPTTSCTLTGLAPSTAYDIAVTAHSDGHSSTEWGEDFAANRQVSTTYTTPATGGAGPTVACVSSLDSDGDRLPNAVETNTGTYLDAAHTGTNPNAVDTDGDSLRDGDETLGTTAGLALPQMGTRPTKKDLLLEYDWFNDSNDPGDCGPHSHQPTAAAIARFTAAFTSSPVSNPDGTTGINVINDYGQGGQFTGGNLVPDADGVIAGGVNDVQFIGIKNANHAANRNGYFHYVLLPHRYGTTSGSSGQAELPGDDLIVSLQCWSSTNNTSNTIMHELGHNLNLGHGGNVHTNWKPNYNSVMNYLHQFPGIDTNCNLAGDGVLDYSRGTRAALNEASLSEAAGVCGGVALDWNLNGVLTPGLISVDINRENGNGAGDGLLQTLQDPNDWSLIYLGGLSDGDGASVSPPEIITEQPVPVEFRD